MGIHRGKWIETGVALYHIRGGNYSRVPTPGGTGPRILREKAPLGQRAERNKRNCQRFVRSRHRVDHYRRGRTTRAAAD